MKAVVYKRNCNGILLQEISTTAYQILRPVYWVEQEIRRLFSDAVLHHKSDRNLGILLGLQVD